MDNSCRGEVAQHDIPDYIFTYPNVQKALSSIDTRESLVEYLGHWPVNSSRRFQYIRRIDGALKCLDGFVELVINVTESTVRDGRARIWGSSALILAQFRKSTTGDEDTILRIFERLTLETKLPCAAPQHISEHYCSSVLQLFDGLGITLLDLAIILEKFPLQGKGNKLKEFEKDHSDAIHRLHMWTSRLRRMSSPAMLSHTPPDSILIPLPSSSIPVALNKYFNGREKDLQAIRKRLNDSHERPAVVGIHGLAGMGKTQLAAKYCKEFDSDYFAYIWVTASEPMKIRQKLSDYAIRMQLQGASITTEPRSNAEALVSWLQTTDKRWLIVYDDIGNPDHLADFWPSGGRGHIIITTKSPYIATFRGSRPHELKPLSIVESENLFYRIVGDGRTVQPTGIMNALLAEWNGHPLALYHMGKIISRSNIDLHRFAKLYRESASDIHQSKNLDDEYPHTIATAFSIRELEPDTKSLLTMLCCLDPDSIPKDIIMSSSAFEGTAYQGGFRLYKALEDLCKSGLVSQSDHTITVHRLVQTVCFSTVSQDERTTAMYQILSFLGSVFPGEKEGKPTWSDWSLCDTYMPHVIFFTQRWQEVFGEGHENSQLAELLSACTWYMVERGLFTEAQSLLETAQSVCPDSEDALQTLAGVLFSLAGVRFECNRIAETLDLCKEVLRIRETLPDPYDPQLGNIMYSIGITYMENGQLQQALNACSRAVEIHRVCEQRGRHDGTPTALAYLDLGLCYWKMSKLKVTEISTLTNKLPFDDLELSCPTNMLGSAFELIVKGLNIFERTSGKCSQKYGQGLTYLALVHEAENRIDDAKEATRASLDICRAITPSEFKTGFGLHKMSGFLHREGKLEDALEYIKEAIIVLKGTFDHAPRVARSQFKMSEILEDMGRQEEASAAREEAKRLRSTITTFEWDSAMNMEAFDTLIPSFLC